MTEFVLNRAGHGFPDKPAEGPWRPVRTSPPAASISHKTYSNSRPKLPRADPDLCHELTMVLAH